ncbi:putative membrane protein [Halarchaeum rubridurum]|uniref:Membrane protein n=1 Tax=Halarchaeum rubridurum TaxID=489911 RepID=A0A830G536_9EURY|nr:PH domain-containing protein [Halarchaeum rubridurum]MBP1955609.1 putative membrane protein [Halarchaeum rubridurum]GGM76677.1 membrane protein [Halarchaeum rubridurum]
MRLHPLTVVYRIGRRAVSLGWGVVVGFAGASSIPFVDARLVVAALAVALLALVGYEVARYRRFTYALAGTTLELRSGVLSRREREIPIERVQNVDVSRSVGQRLLGLATVRVETAGGGSTEALLECVSAAAADDLQTDLRRLKRAAARGDADAEDATGGSGDARPGGEAGAADGVATTGGELDATAGATDEAEVVFDLGRRRLVLASALSFDVRLLSVVFVAQPVVQPLLAPLVGDLAGVTTVVALVVAVLTAVALWVASAARTFARYYGFRLVRAGDDLRYERGLSRRYTGTIPLEKLQTLAVEETALERAFGYASLSVVTAGSVGSNTGGGSAAAVPLATRGDVLALARDLEPFADAAMERPPTRARRRYAVRYALGVGVLLALTTAVNALVTPLPYAWAPALLLVLAPVAAHLKWRNVGVALTDDHAVVQRGFWTRRTRVVPHDRVQTVAVSATLFQRRRELASVAIDTAGGDAVALDCDAERASAIRSRVAERAVDAVGARRDGNDSH